MQEVSTPLHPASTSSATSTSQRGSDTKEKHSRYGTVANPSDYADCSDAVEWLIARRKQEQKVEDKKEMGGKAKKVKKQKKNQKDRLSVFSYGHVDTDQSVEQKKEEGGVPSELGSSSFYCDILPPSGLFARDNSEQREKKGKGLLFSSGIVTLTSEAREATVGVVSPRAEEGEGGSNSGHHHHALSYSEVVPTNLAALSKTKKKAVEDTTSPVNASAYGNPKDEEGSDSSSDSDSSDDKSSDSDSESKEKGGESSSDYSDFSSDDEGEGKFEWESGMLFGTTKEVATYQSPSPKDGSRGNGSSSFVTLLGDYTLEQAETKDDDSGSLDDLPRDEWNERFQRVLLIKDEERRYATLRALEAEFRETASVYGRIIISELFTPNEKKTIKAAGVGGIAGGEKFITRGIFFKLAHDFELSSGRWMYGGNSCSDEKAIKATGHDLKSIIQFYNARVPGIRVPLVCTVDYSGFRLLCMSVLPLSKDSLCYGSSDGGKSFRNSEPQLSESIKEVCKWLNLREHMVAPGTYLHGPGDMEGHKGTDGHFYALDMARLFPPEAPGEGEDMRCIFYNLLRPEFVRRYEKGPLCSDAFSLWGRVDPDCKQHNQDALLATLHLHQELIPNVAAKLERIAKNTKMAPTVPWKDRIDICYYLHKKGVNLRHLGRVRWHVKDPFVREMILNEMVARIFKNELRSQLRDTMRQRVATTGSLSRQNSGSGSHSTSTKLSGAHDLNLLVINFLNTILRHGHVGSKRPQRPDVRALTWHHFVKDRIAEKFGIELTEEEMAGLMRINLGGVLWRFCQKLVIRLRSEYWARIVDSGSHDRSLVVLPDLMDVGTVVKHMNITTLAEGVGMYYDGCRLYHTHPKQAEVLLGNAAQLCDDVAAGVNDLAVHQKAASASAKLAFLLDQLYSASASYDKTRTALLEKKALGYFKRSLKMNGPKEEMALVRLEYGLYLLDKKQALEAEQYLVEAMTMDGSMKERLLERLDTRLAFPMLADQRQERVKIIVPLKAILAVSPGSPQVLRALGEAYARILRYEGRITNWIFGQQINDSEVLVDRFTACATEVLEQAVDLDKNILADYFEEIINTGVLNMNVDILSPFVFVRIALSSEKLTQHIKEPLSKVTKLMFHLQSSDLSPSMETVSKLIPLLCNLRWVNLQRCPTRVPETMSDIGDRYELHVIEKLVLTPGLSYDWLPKMLGLKRLELEGGFDDQVLHAASLTNLTSLSVVSSSASDAAFEKVLAATPSLRHLHVRQCAEATDATLFAISKYCGPNLVYLDLACPYFTDEGMTALFRSLKSIKTMVLDNISGYLSPPPVSDVCFESVPSTLENFTLQAYDGTQHVEIVLRICENIAKRCPNMKRINLHAARADDSAVRELLSIGPSIEYLELIRITPLTDEAFAGLCHTPNMKFLRLAFLSAESKRALLSVGEHCKGLQTVWLDHCKDMDGDTLKEMLKCTRQLRTLVICMRGLKLPPGVWEQLPRTLRSLHLQHIVSSDSDIAEIVDACPRLESLFIGDSDQITNYPLSLLPELRKLRHVGFTLCAGVTEEGIGFLAGCKRLETLACSAALGASARALLPLVKVTAKSFEQELPPELNWGSPLTFE